MKTSPINLVMGLPSLNRSHFLATSLSAASAVSLGLRLDGAPEVSSLKPKHRYLTDASALSAGSTTSTPTTCRSISTSPTAI